MLNINFISILLFIIILSKKFASDERFNMGKAVSHGKRSNSFQFSKASVASDRKECSDIGVDILRKGGSAVDSSISTLLCLGLLNPHSSGLGGGGYMLISIPSKNEQKFIDFRETAPICSPTFINASSDAVKKGGLSVATPSELFGLRVAWEKYGKLPWRDLILPVSNLAINGFVVGESEAIAAEKWKVEILKDPLLKKILSIDNKIKEIGDKTKNPILGNFLNIIAYLSFDNFDLKMRQNIFSQISEEIKSHGGCLSKTDFENYRVKISDPMSITFGSLKILIPPPTTSGPVLAFILNMIKGLNFERTDFKANPEIVYHSMIQIFSLGYKLRLMLADPDFEDSVDQFSAEIITKEFSDEVFKDWNTNSILSNRIWEKVNKMNSHPITTGTTHVSIIDSENNAVSVTSTVNGYFGAKFGSNKFGFVYNNEMDDFSYPNVKFNEFFLPISSLNYPLPGKKPQSSSVPVIILDEKNNTVLIIGGAGGSMITSAVAQVLMYHLIFGMTPKEAVDMPRLHYQNTPNIVLVEPGFDLNIIEKLRKLGHKVVINGYYHAVVQIVSKLDKEDNCMQDSFRKGSIHYLRNTIYAESDYRKGGFPAGY